MTYIQKNFLSLLTLFVLAIFFFAFMRGCFAPKQLPAITTIERDTVWGQYTSPTPIQTQPIVIATQPPTLPQTNTIREIIYRNDTAAIKDILTRYFSESNYSNTLKIDTIGTVTVIDTISQNSIKGRSYTYNLKYPVITNTITIKEPYQPRNQLYAGFEVGGNKSQLINNFGAGLLLKNKKDNIFKLNATLGIKGELGANLGFYKKISF